MKITKANLLRGACYLFIAGCLGSITVDLYNRLSHEARAAPATTSPLEQVAEEETTLQEATQNKGYLIPLLSLFAQRPQQTSLPPYDPVRASLEEGCPVSEDNFYNHRDTLLTSLDEVDGQRTPTGVIANLGTSWRGMLHSYYVLHDAPHDVETQPWVSVCTDPMPKMEIEIKKVLEQARTYKGTENEPLYFFFQEGLAESPVNLYPEFEGYLADEETLYLSTPSL